MKIKNFDHVSINVIDLLAAKAFFVDLGLEVFAEWEMEGEWLGKVVGLNNVKTACVGLRSSGSKTWIELVKYWTPSDEHKAEEAFANTLGIRHIAFEVDNLDDLVANLKAKGTETFSEVMIYEDIYKLCYVRGPEGIILELAQKIN